MTKKELIEKIKNNNGERFDLLEDEILDYKQISQYNKRTFVKIVQSMVAFGNVDYNEHFIIVGVSDDERTTTNNCMGFEDFTSHLVKIIEPNTNLSKLNYSFQTVNTKKKHIVYLITVQRNKMDNNLFCFIKKPNEIKNDTEIYYLRKAESKYPMKSRDITGWHAKFNNMYYDKGSDFMKLDSEIKYNLDDIKTAIRQIRKINKRELFIDELFIPEKMLNSKTDFEIILRENDLINKINYTNLGVLFFGIKNEKIEWNRIKVMAFYYDKGINDWEFNDPLLINIENVTNCFKNYYPRNSLKSDSSPFSSTRDIIPLISFREIFQNAIAYNKYSNEYYWNRPIELRFEVDKLEIINYGEPLVELRNGEKEYPDISQYRSKSLIRLLKKLGVVENSKSGIKKARNELVLYKEKYDPKNTLYQSGNLTFKTINEDNFKIIITKAIFYYFQNRKKIEKDKIEEAKIKLLINQMKFNPKITKKELGEKNNINPKQLSILIEKMKVSNLLEEQGTQKSPIWILKSEHYKK